MFLIHKQLLFLLGADLIPAHLFHLPMLERKLQAQCQAVWPLGTGKPAGLRHGLRAGMACRAFTGAESAHGVAFQRLRPFVLRQGAAGFCHSAQLFPDARCPVYDEPVDGGRDQMDKPYGLSAAGKLRRRAHMAAA